MNSIESELKTYWVEDVGRRRPLTGYFLSETSNRSPYKQHWTELRLYRTEDNRYVLSVLGCSVVYHEPHSDCNSGVTTKIADLDDDRYDELVPCQRCNPDDLDDIPEERSVDVEQVRPTVHVCATAADLIAKLRDPKSPSGAISGLGQRLLGNAVRLDEELKRAMNVVEPI